MYGPVGSFPVSSLPVAALSQGSFLFVTEIDGSSKLTARPTNPVADIIGDPNNRLVLAVSIVATDLT